jgi:hypothetical protein
MQGVKRPERHCCKYMLEGLCESKKIDYLDIGIPPKVIFNHHRC